MITNNNGLPLSLAAWLAHDEYDHNKADMTISATSLLKPTKSILLGNVGSAESDIDVVDLAASRMGTALHSSIESFWLGPKNATKAMELLGYPKKLIESVKINPENPNEDDLNIYMEIRSDKEVEGFTVTGKFDFICDGQLEDFKSTSTFTYVNQTNREKYIQQGSIYRWLNPHLVTNDIMRINFLFTDWSAAKAKQDPKYPATKVLSQELPLMSQFDTELFIKAKLLELKKYQGMDQDSMPACTSEEVWERPSVFKYYKDPAKKTRSTKNFDTYWEANQRYTDDGSVGEIVEVKGDVVYCNYCPAKNICKQAQGYIQDGRLSA